MPKTRECHLTLDTITVPKGGLLFQSEDGRPLVLISQKDGAGAFHVFGQNGKSMCRVALFGEVVNLTIGPDEECIALNVQSGRGAALSLIDPSAKESVRLEASVAGGTVTTGNGGELRTQMIARSDGGGIGVFGPGGKCAAGMKVLPSGGHAFVSDPDENMRVEMMADGGSGVFCVSDRDNGLTFGVPIWNFTQPVQESGQESIGQESVRQESVRQESVPKRRQSRRNHDQTADSPKAGIG